jgi:crossover junction endodeoxyribonuclease RusA
MAEEAITPLYFELPYPPSLNGIWRGGKGGRHYLSLKYRQWRDEAGLLAKSQAKGKRIAGPYAIQIDVVRPDKRRRDLDNLIKVSLDLLANIGVTDDDCECQYIEAKWVEIGPPLRLSVRPCLRWGASPWTSQAQGNG